jgi:hypothetical protein
MPEPGEDPALGDLDADFRLGFVPRFRRSRRQNRGLVVRGPLGVRALQNRFIAAEIAHAGLHLIGERSGLARR